MDLLNRGTVENQGLNVPKTLNDSVPGTEPGNTVPGTDPRPGAKSAVLKTLNDSVPSTEPGNRVPGTDPRTGAKSAVLKTLNDSVPGTEPGNSVPGTDPRTGAKSAVPTPEKDLKSDKVPEMGPENGEMNNNIKLDRLPKDTGVATKLQLPSVLLNLQVKVKKFELNIGEMFKVTKLMLASLPESKYKSSEVGTDYDSDKTEVYYDSDKTEIYYPIEADKLKPKHVLLLNKGIKVNHLNNPKKCLIHAHPSRGGFQISVHGLLKWCTQTYVGCKIPECKVTFASICDWNSHHRKYHKSLKLYCVKCNKLFRTQSYLRDHSYVYSDKIFPCKKCNKVFSFCSSYRIHGRTHLRVRIHKCFTGSCGREYKWPQDLHRHIQSYLTITYGCSVCNYTKSQKYLLKRHQKVHDDKMYYSCELCPLQCKHYTQLNQHCLKCPNQLTVE